jgi:enoyl-CoA hydratase/carnithine racemase
MQYQHIKYEVSDRILTITLNRPDRLNAYTDEIMLPEMKDALDRADNDDDIRAVIVTGAGRSFCAGVDISGRNPFDFARESTEGETLPRDGGGTLALRMYDAKKPMIAAINGAAVGVGITMTLPMDIRLASETAKMGFVFARRGIVIESCSSWFLPRLVGVSQALEWACTGRIFSAQEALAGGLVKEVLPPDRLMPRARQLAQEIAENTSAISVALTRQLIWKMLGADHPMEAHKIESKLLFSLGARDDVYEGIKAFLEKRPPAFKMGPSRDMPECYPWWKERPFP